MINKGKLLIVEDEFVVAENLRSDIESMGFTVVGMASSGNEALSLAQKKVPDLVLMDIQLHGKMDGVETAIRLRREFDIPVLFLTAFADEGFLERAKTAEPLGYIIKPYERKGLRASVEVAHYKARMERLLKASESRFRAMFENSPVAYLILDENGCCYDWNAEFNRLAGYLPEALAGTPFITFLSPETQSLFQRKWANCNDFDQFQVEIDLQHPNDILCNVIFEGRVQRNLNGEFLRMHCILHDVTERKRLEKERLELMQERQQIQKAESLSRMAGATAHHFNNMLAVVIGNLELVLEDLPPRMNCLENIHDALNAAERAAEMSRFMLTFLGQSIQNTKPLDLSTVCRRIIENLRQTVSENIRLLSDFPVPGPLIHTNAKQMERMLTELINNASEAIGQNTGEITVLARTVDCIETSGSQIWPPGWKPVDSAYAVLQITDTGCGISESDMDKIMDPFFSTKFTGRGTGLPMVLGIVRAHEGSIAVKSDVNRGSVFQVFFPLAD